MKENDIKTAIIQYLTCTDWLTLRINSGQDRRRFFYYVKWFLNGDDPQTSGCFDIIAIKSGFQPLAIDAKAPGKLAEVSDAQRRFMAAWQAHGGTALVVDNLDDLIVALDR